MPPAGVGDRGGYVRSHVVSTLGLLHLFHQMIAWKQSKEETIRFAVERLRRYCSLAIAHLGGPRRVDVQLGAAACEMEAF